MSPPTIGRFSFVNRILRLINGLRYTRQPPCIIRASSSAVADGGPAASDFVLVVAEKEAGKIEIGGAIVRVGAGAEFVFLGKALRLLKALK